MNLSIFFIGLLISFLIILLILFLSFLLVELRKKIAADLLVVSHGIVRIFLIALLISVIPKILNIMPIVDIIDKIGLIGILASLVIFIILIVTVVLLNKDDIVGFMRVIDYYIHKKNIFKKGYTQLGKITKINKICLFLGARLSTYIVYYLIVDVNGKKIKSLYFRNNIYSIGENIDVMVYKKHNYVMLKDK